jgi:hypothetical protein
MQVADLPGSRSVVASFADDARARAAIGRLRAAGIPGHAMSIARRAAPPPPEALTLSRVFWSGFWWSVVGGIAGALLGLVVGALGWGVPGTPANIGIQVASWAMFGHVVGALAGCYLALDTGDRFARTPDHHDAAVTLVRVRTADAAALARAEEVMLRMGALLVE